MAIQKFRLEVHTKIKNMASFVLKIVTTHPVIHNHPGLARNEIPTWGGILLLYDTRYTRAFTSATENIEGKWRFKRELLGDLRLED